jgi:Zn-dependent peptidase ImmA (M78 family)
MAHELGHLTMHAAPPDGDPEEQADAFAGEFLTPESLLRPDLRRLDFNRLPTLKAYWRISMKALIKRADVVGAINHASATRLYKQYSARRYNVQEPYPLASERSTIIPEAIRVHLEQHGYTRGELAEAVLLRVDEFERDLMGSISTKSNVIRLFPAAG